MSIFKRRAHVDFERRATDMGVLTYDGPKRKWTWVHTLTEER
jgi:hypothetical protein